MKWTADKVRDEIGGTCELGITNDELKAFLSPARLIEFHQWMYGQTVGLCEGKQWNHDTKQYEPACDGVAHGSAYYSWDVARFLNNQPIID